jgi:dihydrofolate synthase/folylpolyglutamate synthase
VSFADKRFECILGENDVLKGERIFGIKNMVNQKKSEGITVLGGDCQSKNIQAVFSVFDTLKEVFMCSEKNIIDGIRNVVINTGLKGRWQILNTRPLTICDTGHNREGLQYVINQINRIPKSGLHMVIGFVNDKDLKLILPLFPAEAVYYFTKASVPRALNEESLKNEAVKFGLKGECYPDVNSALSCARENASQSDMIFIGGSTFVVAEVI